MKLKWSSSLLSDLVKVKESRGRQIRPPQIAPFREETASNVMYSLTQHDTWTHILGSLQESALWEWGNKKGAVTESQLGFCFPVVLLFFPLVLFLSNEFNLLWEENKHLLFQEGFLVTHLRGNLLTSQDTASLNILSCLFDSSGDWNIVFISFVPSLHTTLTAPTRDCPGCHGMNWRWP